MINKETVRKSINDLLAEMLEKKITAKQKEVDALIAKDVSEANPKFIRAVKALNEMESQYQYDNWLHHAAHSMTKSATLATHISKGVHSMSRGDSVLFTDTSNRPKHIVGSHNIVSDVLDISGSAASLPIYNFINLEVGETTIKQLILDSSPVMIGALSDDRDIALELLSKFQEFLEKQVEIPVTSELNKQLLFPKNGDSFDIESLDDLEYETVVPLYASVFCHEVRNKINGIIYSEENREAAKNRFAKNADELDHEQYKTIRNLASIKLGGSKPANVSKVVVMSNGEMVLLPNLPPENKQPSDYWYVSKSTKSIFKGALRGWMQYAIDEFVSSSIAYDQYLVAKNKKRKKVALRSLIVKIIEHAHLMQKHEAGWLTDHALVLHEKLWLDPLRCNLEGQTNYARKYAEDDWQDKVMDSIAHFVNDTAKSMCDKKPELFNVDSFNEIRAEVEATVKAFKRNNREVWYGY